jgi:hypothetical protein
MKRGLLVVLLIVAAGFAYRLNAPSWIASRIGGNAAPTVTVENETFTCQGKTRCREMTSCAEAKFYLRNCPGTKMDGDHDGIPCESQWCGDEAD